MSEGEVDDDIKDEDLQRMVEELLVKTKSYLAHLMLTTHAKRAEPFLLRAFSDQRYYENNDGYGALRSLITLLGRIAPPEAVRPAIRLLQLPEPTLRREAGFLLGCIATDECIEPILQCLSDADNETRSHTCIGLSGAISSGRVSPKFREAMFEPLARLIRPTSAAVDSHAPECLVRLDTKRATPILLNELILNIENAMLHDVLNSLFLGRVSVPAEQLSRLLKDVKANLRSHPKYGLYYQDLLLLLALSNHPEAMSNIREVLEQSADEDLQTRAAHALCVLRGAIDPIEFCGQRFSSAGLAGMSSAQKSVYLPCLLGGAVSNGGLCSFFYNPGAGDYSQETLAALQEIRATRQAEIFRQALRVFGKDGPSSDFKRRDEQYRALLDSGEIEKLPSDEELEQHKLYKLAYLYAAEHIADFK